MSELKTLSDAWLQLTSVDYREIKNESGTSNTEAEPTASPSNYVAKYAKWQDIDEQQIDEWVKKKESNYKGKTALELLRELLSPKRAKADALAITFAEAVEQVKDKKAKDDVRLQVTREAINTVDALRDAEEGILKESEEGLSLIERFIKWGLKKTIKWVLKEVIWRSVKFVLKYTMALISDVFDFILEEFIEPVLAITLDFALANPITAALLAIGGAVGVGYMLWKKLWGPEATGTPAKAQETNYAEVHERISQLTTSSFTPVAIVPLAPAPAGTPLATDITTERQRASASKLIKRATSSVMDAIHYAATKVGTDEGAMVAFAGRESSFNPNASAGSTTAEGLFQFVTKTWNAELLKYGKIVGVPLNASRMDPVASSLIEAAMLKYEIIPAISKVVGKPTVTDLYFGHFLGPAGGAHFLRNLKRKPNAPAYLDMREAASYNKSVFFDPQGRPRTYAQIYNLFSGSLQATADLAKQKTDVANTPVSVAQGVSTEKAKKKEQAKLAVASASVSHANAKHKTIVKSKRGYLVAMAN